MVASTRHADNRRETRATNPQLHKGRNAGGQFFGTVIGLKSQIRQKRIFRICGFAWRGVKTLTKTPLALTALMLLSSAASYFIYPAARISSRRSNDTDGGIVVGRDERLREADAKVVDIPEVNGDVASNNNATGFVSIRSDGRSGVLGGDVGGQEEAKAGLGRWRPLFIGAGQGTTGTRTMAEAMCLLGIPTLHFGKPACVTANGESRDMLGGMKAQWRVVRAYRALQRCDGGGGLASSSSSSSPPSPGNNSCSLSTTRRLFEALRSQMRLVLRSPIGAVLDTPYPAMYSFVTEEAKRIRGTAPIVLLTRRNYTDWARRRREEHGDDLVCGHFGPSLGVGEGGDGVSGEYGSGGGQAVLNRISLDWNECYESAIGRDPSPLSFGEVFLSLHSAVKMIGSERTDRLSSAALEEMERRVMRDQPRYVVNLWERQLDVENIAKEIFEAIAADETSTNITTWLRESRKAKLTRMPLNWFG